MISGGPRVTIFSVGRGNSIMVRAQYNDINKQEIHTRDNLSTVVHKESVKSRGCCGVVWLHLF